MDPNQTADATECRRVLLVDDEPAVTASIAVQFGRTYEIVCATSAEQAIEHVAHGPAFAVVMSDLRMPGMDGIRLLARIREQAPHTVRILLTGHADVETAVEAVNAGGIFRLLLKPCGREGLQRALEAAVAEHQKRVRESLAASEDPLLHIGTRRAFEEAFSRVHYHAVRHERRYGIVMVDVDHFKLYNDSCGHPAGDEVLARIAKTLRTSCRLSDEVFRYGGEEMVLLLPDTHAEGLMIGCERFRAGVQSLGIVHPMAAAGVVTISVGAAAFNPPETIEQTLLLRRADQALYQSKASGRNRCTLWQG